MKSPARVALAGLTLLACSSEVSGVRVFAPRCADQDDLQPFLDEQVESLDQTLTDVGLAYERLEQPTWKALSDLIEARRGWFLLAYAGHGARPQGLSSRICLASAHAAPNAESSALIGVNDQLMKALPEELSGATLILDACESAQVDPRQARIPVSVISSSPYVVGADSLFGDRLGWAVREASADPNCDGLVTDQEVFDALLLIMSSEISVAADRAYPKLRRNASSHLPLPIVPRLRQECANTVRVMKELQTRLRREHGPDGKSPNPEMIQLADALHAQTQLEPMSRDKVLLPKTDCDYFIIDGPRNGAHAEIVRAAKAAGLCEFSIPDPKLAGQVAHFAIFAEFYRFTPRCKMPEDDGDARRWVLITRLRDNMLVGVERVGQLARGIPSRKSLSLRQIVDPDRPDSARELCLFRHVGEVSTDVGVGMPAHCTEPDGQCFEAPCPGETSRQR